MASFCQLAPELIALIAHNLMGPDPTDLACFMGTNRLCRTIVAPRLYSKHGQSIVRWAAAQGNLYSIRAALRFAATPEAKLELVNGYDSSCYPSPKELREAMLADLPKHLGVAYAPLHIASLYGRTEVIECLLDNGADIKASAPGLCRCKYLHASVFQSMATSPRWLPLHYAICRKHVEAASLLLDRGAPLYVDFYSDVEGFSATALQSAIEHGLVDIVHRLKETYIQLRAHAPDRATIVSSASGMLPPTVSEEENVENDEYSEPEDMDNSEEDAFEDAHAGNIRSSVKSYIARLIREPFVPDVDGCSAIHYVSMCFNYESACAIIQDLNDLVFETGIEPNRRRSTTALFYSACNGNFPAARALLQAGVSIDMKYDGGEEDAPRPARRAALGILRNALSAEYGPRAFAYGLSSSSWARSRLDFVIDLLTAGIDADHQPSHSEDFTALMIAAKNGLVEEMKLLLVLGGARVNTALPAGATALTLAASSGQLESMKVLLDAGASVKKAFILDLIPDIYDKYGFPCTREMLILLLESGVDLSVGRNPIHENRRQSYHDAFLFKVVQGAGRSIHDNQDAPLHEGASIDHKDVHILDTVLQHATAGNIPPHCWQSAVAAAIDTEEPLARKVLCRKLAVFGRRMHYLFDDHFLGSYLRGMPDDHGVVEPFFGLGDGDGVQTHTGVLSKAALLAILLERPEMPEITIGSETFKLAGQAAQALIKDITVTKGRIYALRAQPTLLHLASARANSYNVDTLIKRGWDIHAPDAYLHTPLTYAAWAGKLRNVQFLLDAGADPYLKKSPDPSLARDSLLGRDDDLLKLPDRRRLARCVPELLAAMEDQWPVPRAPQSPFEAAVIFNHTSVLDEFAQRFPHLPRIPSNCRSSILHDACRNLSWDAVHWLLSAGVDPNGGSESVAGSVCPPICFALAELERCDPASGLPNSLAAPAGMRSDKITTTVGVLQHLICAGAVLDQKCAKGLTKHVAILERLMRYNHGKRPRSNSYRSPGQEIRDQLQRRFVIETDDAGRKTVKCLVQYEQLDASSLASFARQW